MNSDSRRLSLSLILASTLHAAVATSLLSVEVEEVQRQPYPEGEYIELGDVEIPFGEQVIQPEVVKTAPAEVLPAKAQSSSQELPEKISVVEEQDLNNESLLDQTNAVEEVVEAIPTTNAISENFSEDYDQLQDEAAQALAEDYMQESQQALALAQNTNHKIAEDEVLKRRRALQAQRQLEMERQEQQRQQRQQLARLQRQKTQNKASSQTSTPFGLPHGSQDARNLKQLPGNPKPVYPAPARRKGWQGQVVLAYYVTASGYVKSLKVQKSSGYQMLDAEAVRSISRYRYTPGQAGWTYHPVQFSLSGQAQVEFSGLRTTR